MIFASSSVTFENFRRKEINLYGLLGSAHYRPWSITRVLHMHLYARHRVVKSPTPAIDRKSTPGRLNGYIDHMR